MYEDDDYLSLSGIQHFSFCRRQWGLIHLEQAWSDNVLTAEGSLMHRRAHDESIRERRGDLLIVRGLMVRSRSLGLVGKCDVVEFRSDAQGCFLFGEDGLWRMNPVEYKRGASKVSDADRLQLCAQAMCLEEMLGGEIAEGSLYYGKTKSRERVAFGATLRRAVIEMTSEMHQLFKRKSTPKARPSAACQSCSIRDQCLPRAGGRTTVESYINSALMEDV